MTSAKKPVVVIGIPTFKRPAGLLRLLDSLAALETGVTPHILVVDNEGPDGQGIKAAQELEKSGYRWPLTAVAEPARGISQARNKLLAVGFGDLQADFLAMVDDDERVEPQWLQALLDCQAELGVDAVAGQMKPEFPAGAPEWCKNLGIYQSGRGLKYGYIPYATSTANILLAKSVVTYGQEFDPYFSVYGGGDKDFFMRLQRHGATSAFTPFAVSYEMFGASRITRKWAVKRAFRIGSGETLMEWRYSRYKLPLTAVRAAARVVAGIPLVVVLAPFNRYNMKAVNFLAFNLGRLVGLMKYHVREYVTTHKI